MEPSSPNANAPEKDVGIEMPEDIRQLLENSAAVSLCTDELLREYNDTFEDTRLVMGEAESESRKQELETFITKSKANQVESERKIQENAVDLQQMRSKVEEQTREQDDLLREQSKGPYNATTISVPYSTNCNWFPSIQRKIMIAGGAFVLVLLLVIILFLTIPR